MSFDKFQARRKLGNEASAYAWWWWGNNHHARYSRYVEAHGLVCQECGGAGGEVDPVIDWQQGPFEECGWCEGTGRVTRWLRGQWLRWKRERRALYG